MTRHINPQPSHWPPLIKMDAKVSESGEGFRFNQVNDDAKKEFLTAEWKHLAILILAAP